MEENKLKIAIDLIEANSNRLNVLENKIHKIEIETRVLRILQGTFYIFGILALAAIISWLFFGIPIDLNIV